MGSFSIWHLLILAVVVFLLFGRGKVSDLMGDVAKGIKNFREGLKDHEEEEQRPHVITAERREDRAAPADPDRSQDRAKEQAGR